MAFLKAVLGFLWMLLRNLLYRWILALSHVLRGLCAQWCRVCARKHLPGRRGKASPKQCVTLSDPAVKRPDPLIYDQYYLMALGFAVTWDNPDIWLEQGGGIVPPEDLKPDTTYDVVARIWNGSTEGSCVGLPVHFSYLSFGIGVKSHPVTPGPKDVTVNLGVKGGPNSPAFARTKWRTPAVPGHYCLQASFNWIDDYNPYNNLGQDNTLVGVSHSPVQFEFQLRNGTGFSDEFRFETDSYSIPRLPPCDRRRPEIHSGISAITQRPFDPVNVPSQHIRANHPLPAGWDVTFSPANPILDPGQEITVAAMVSPPNDLTGRQPINVHAFTKSGLAGGITFYVQGT
jgi:hypothetical protein